MTPERGPLPPLLPCPFCGGIDIRITDHGRIGTGMHHHGDNVFSMCCYDCGATFPNCYRRSLFHEKWNTRAAAEVARLAGQAVAWEYTTPATSDDWTPCPRDFFEKIKDSPNYKVRALGVIATPSADGADGRTGGMMSTHIDDAGVDKLAVAMKAKLKEKRDQGYSGWEDKNLCPRAELSHMLRTHIDKGDPVDVANLAMMLFNRGEGIMPVLKTHDVLQARVTGTNTWLNVDLKTYHALAKQEDWVVRSLRINHSSDDPK